jgi:hypothetical protein
MPDPIPSPDEPSVILPGPRDERRESLLSRVLRYSLTGPDDRTFELVEIIGAFGFVVGVLLEIVDFVLQWALGIEGSFNFAIYMGGLSVGMGALAASQRLRDGRTQGGA